MTSIKSSLDWNSVESRLLHTCTGLTYEWDVRRMIGNINAEVSNLSKAEVEARRGKKQLAEELLTKVNNDIELVEEYLLMAALLG